MNFAKIVKILAVIVAACGLTVAVVPLSVYVLIETAGSHAKMVCEPACVVATIIGALLVFVAVASLFVNSVRLSVTASALMLSFGAATIIVPQVIGFCAMDSMACQYITKPTLASLGVVVLVLSSLRLALDSSTMKQDAR